jgi:NDP-sugar pyrophosphorylase family protein
MVPVCGKPILWHQVRWLRAGGISDIVFLAGYRWETIREFFGDGRDHGFRAHYSVEETPLGRGGAIRKGLDLVGRENAFVVVTNGDIVTGQPLADIVERFRRDRQHDQAHQATILAVPFVSPYGLVDMDSHDQVTGFREKAPLPYWINGGIYVFARAIENLLPELGDHETSTFPALAAQGRMAALRSTAFWRSVDSFKDLRDAEEYLAALGGPLAGSESER